MDWNDPGAISRLVARLVGLGRETEWLECKVNNGDPGEIGEYISALANTALLVGQEAGFMLWGVDDNQHLLGTAFDPWSAKIGNEDLVPWLARMLDPSIEFSFHRVELEGKSVVLMRVEAAGTQPVAFKKRHFIRVGSYKKPLDDHPDHQRRLWKALDTYAFEDRTAIGGLTVEQAVEFIDYPSFFSLRRTPLPESRSGIVEALQDAGVLTYDVEDEWQITNGGALLYARDLSRFGSLGRKAPRVVQYEGTSRIKTQREQVGQLGYAAGFQRLVAYVLDALPRSEVIELGLRKDATLFPDLAIRELVANALIHQDLTVKGAGPLIEIFDDRLEITNPGRPLLDPLRFIDSAPRSRNEQLGMELRTIGVCEERGSGWDKIAFEIEFHQLPPALVEVLDDQTRVSLFAPKPLNAMARPERVRAMYQHACLQYVSNKPTNNTSVRGRFGIEDRNKAQASRIIREATEEEMIVAYDPQAGPRSIRYVPFWADPER